VSGVGGIGGVDGIDARLALLDYRRRVGGMYRAARAAAPDALARWQSFRQSRDELLNQHPQTPLPARRRGGHESLPFYPYDPAWRIEASVVSAVPTEHSLTLRVDGEVALQRFGYADFMVSQVALRLPLDWVGGYGGGLLISFRDATSGAETYGGGRYLLDTIKGADLGERDGRLILDFNYAYNPSCAYDPQWHCPLPNRESWLSIAVRAGERLPPGTSPAGYPPQ
jgi:uncharacterized protein (DUF1684 family)